MSEISVIIPTHNRAPLLGRAIKSVLAQTCPPHELIVVDDGSADATGELVRSWREQMHSGIALHYLYQERRGPSAARNAGMAASSGDWIAFLDSDDRWLPEKLEWQIRATTQFGEQYGLCFTDARYVNNPHWDQTAFGRAARSYDGTLGTIRHPSAFIASADHGVYIQTVLIRKDLAQKIGGFDPKLSIFEDNDFVFRAALRTGFCFVNKPLVEVDRTPGRSEGLIELNSDGGFRLQQQEYEYWKWLNGGDALDPDVRKLILTRLQRVHAGWASWHLINHHYARAKEATSAALAYGFRVRLAAKWVLISAMPGFTRRIVLDRYNRSKEATLPGF